jgi:hypothetical protein
MRPELQELVARGRERISAPTADRDLASGDGETRGAGEA